MLVQDPEVSFCGCSRARNTPPGQLCHTGPVVKLSRLCDGTAASHARNMCDSAGGDSGHHAARLAQTEHGQGQLCSIWRGLVQDATPGTEGSGDDGGCLAATGHRRRCRPPGMGCLSLSEGCR